MVICRECRKRNRPDCPMYFEECVEWDEDGYPDYETIVHNRTRDEGYCDRGERFDQSQSGD